jgi:hypothetical protein
MTDEVNKKRYTAKTIINEERMMNRLARKKDDKNERGSALVLTLGILSLVLIMGMSFAFSSRTSRQVAKVNADQVKANLHSESGLDYALSILKDRFIDDDGIQKLYPPSYKLDDSVQATDYEKRFDFRQNDLVFKSEIASHKYWGHQHIWSYIPYDGKADNSNDEEVTSDDDKDDSGRFNINREKHSFYYTLMNEVPQLRLQVLQNVSRDDTDNDWPSELNQLSLKVVTGTDYTEVEEYLKKVGFHTIKSGDEIVGRVGFIVLEEGHKFDVNQLLSLKGDSSDGDVPFVLNSDQERCANRLLDKWEDETPDKQYRNYYYNIAGDYKPKKLQNGEDGDTIRLGLHIQELDAGLSAYYKNLPVGTAIGNAEARVRWMSYDHLWKGLYNTSAELDNKLYNIYSGSPFKDDCMRYTFFSIEEPEAWLYRDDTKDIEVARFDVTGYEWRDSNNNYYEKASDEYKPATVITLTGGGKEKANGWEELSTDVDKEDRIKDLAFVSDNEGNRLDMTADNLPEFKDKDHYEPAESIPALGGMKDKDEKSVSLQVAANMVDYCDSDYYASYVVDASGNPAGTFDKSKLVGTDTITENFKICYCGNEKVAYFNEVALQFLIERSFDLDEHTYTYRMKMMPQVEMANMFGDDDKVPDGKGGKENIKIGEIVVRVKGNFSIACSNGTAGHGMTISTPNHTDDHPTANEPTNKEFELVFTRKANGNWSDGYSQIEFNVVGGSELIFEYKEAGQLLPEDPENPGVSRYQSAEVTYTVNVTDVTMVSWNDETDPDVSDAENKIYDIGQWKASEIEDNNKHFKFTYKYDSEESISNSYVPAYIYASLEANDPRCNHRSIGWAWKNDGAADDNKFISIPNDSHSEFSDSAFHTLGNENTIFKPANANGYYGTGDDLCDKEDNTAKIYNLSTSFIRNAPFESLWELGAIHRGEPFRTINLSVFSDECYDNGFSGKYEHGDAHILDQVKIGPAHYSRGKFNVNSRSSASFAILYDDELFSKKDEYDKLDNSTSNPIEMPDWIFIDEHGKLLEPHISRGQIVTLIDNIDDYENDREKESFIGRTANLLTTRNEAYTVVVVSQALQERKDLEDNLRAVLGLASGADLSVANKKDENVKKILATSTINPTWYDVYESSSNHKEHLCEVLGTNVIMAHVVRDAWTGKMTVVRKEYLNGSN